MPVITGFNAVAYTTVPPAEGSSIAPNDPVVQQIARRAAARVERWTMNNVRVQTTCTRGSGVTNWADTGTNAYYRVINDCGTTHGRIKSVKWATTATDNPWEDCTVCGTADDDPWELNYSLTTAGNSTIYATFKWSNGEAWETVKDPARYRQVEELVKPDPAKRIQEILAARRGPMVITGHRKPLPPPDIREVRARETLRRVIGDEKFKSFLRDGFVSTRGKDGKFYQLYPGHGITHVFEAGKLIEKLCVVWQGDFTPTDSLIMRYLLVLNDPQGFWKVAIKHGRDDHRPKFQLKPVVADRNLSDIFRDVKNDPGRKVVRYERIEKLAPTG